MESMDELGRRIDELRRLLDGEVEPAQGQCSPLLDLDSGHRPAHAAPGPLLDELTTPETVIRIEVDDQRPRTPQHAAPSAVD